MTVFAACGPTPSATMINGCHQMLPGSRELGHASLILSIPSALPKEMRPRVLELSNLETEAAYKGKGHATRLMHTVCDEADAHGMALMLEPKSFGDGPNDRTLQAWYFRRFGFVVFQNGKDDLPTLMIRTPK